MELTGKEMREVIRQRVMVRVEKKLMPYLWLALLLFLFGAIGSVVSIGSLVAQYLLGILAVLSIIAIFSCVGYLCYMGWKVQSDMLEKYLENDDTELKQEDIRA